MSKPTFVLNGKEQPLSAHTLEGVLHEAGVATDGRGLAVSLNEAVVPRTAWDDTAVGPGDRVEVVKVFSGG